MKFAAPFVFGALLAVIAAQPAQADRCDDIAKQLARNVDGLKVGRTVAGIVYLTHPSAKQASLGCSARNKMNEVFEKFPLTSETATRPLNHLLTWRTETMPGGTAAYGSIGAAGATGAVTSSPRRAGNGPR